MHQIITIFYIEIDLQWLFSQIATNPLLVKIIYLENLMLEPMNCAMKTVA